VELVVGDVGPHDERRRYRALIRDDADAAEAVEVLAGLQVELGIFDKVIT
jgi:hypothetical protein